MKKLKRWPWLLYVAELIMLVIAITFVAHWIPDLSNFPDVTSVGESSLEANREDSETTKPTEEGLQEDKETGLYETEEADRETYTGDVAEAGGRKPGEGAADAPAEEVLEEAYNPPVMIVASDLHYMSPTMTNFGDALTLYTEGSDGKVVPYIDEITDAFLEEVAEQKPSVLILSGDISQDGEKVNHGELARKLRRLQSRGVPVLVIPGNHDINHPWAATYYGSQVVPTENVNADGFYDIYHEFGYDQAAGRDDDSLSYLYKLDERYWIMMLDSCIYEPENQVGGRIKKTTLAWMEDWLCRAKEKGVTVIPVAHHNLLKESVLYPEDCTLENSRQVIDLLESYGLPIYISGHLHLQRVKKNINSPAAPAGYGIHEIVSSSLSIPPCQYGVIEWLSDGSLSYETRAVDVAAWAAKRENKNEDLLNFSEYSRRFLVEVISSQAYRSIDSIPKERKREMAELYGTLNSAYCAGMPISASEIKASETYFYWERYLGSTKWFDRLSAILKDTKNDHNKLKLKSGIDFPANNAGNTGSKKENQE